MKSSELRLRMALSALLCLVASLVFGSPVGAAEDQATCGGRAVTIYGAVQLAEDPQPNPRPDRYDGPVIVGTEGDDVILGTDGDEWILGLGGDDVICGLRGEDYLTGGPGRDRLRGGAGPDHISGSGLDEILRGGAGQDEIVIFTYNGVPFQDADLGQGGSKFLEFPSNATGERVPDPGKGILSCPGPPTGCGGQWWF